MFQLQNNHNYFYNHVFMFDLYCCVHSAFIKDKRVLRRRRIPALPTNRRTRSPSKLTETSFFRPAATFRASQDPKPLSPRPSKVCSLLFLDFCCMHVCVCVCVCCCIGATVSTLALWFVCLFVCFVCFCYCRLIE